MSIALTGLASPGGDEQRALAYVDVVHNGQTYNWQMFVPVGENANDAVVAAESKLKAAIDAKEAEWAALDPKTRNIEDPLTGEVTQVPIEKSEIVCPDIPDYFAKRRAAYPSLGDQLDAMWKGGQEAADMQAKIQAVKQQYPKS